MLHKLSQSLPPYLAQLRGAVLHSLAKGLLGTLRGPSVPPPASESPLQCCYAPCCHHQGHGRLAALVPPGPAEPAQGGLLSSAGRPGASSPIAGAHRSCVLRGQVGPTHPASKTAARMDGPTDGQDRQIGRCMEENIVQQVYRGEHHAAGVWRGSHTGLTLLNVRRDNALVQWYNGTMATSSFLRPETQRKHSGTLYL